MLEFFSGQTLFITGLIILAAALLLGVLAAFILVIRWIRLNHSFDEEYGKAISVSLRKR